MVLKCRVLELQALLVTFCVSYLVDLKLTPSFSELKSTPTDGFNNHFNYYFGNSAQ